MAINWSVSKPDALLINQIAHRAFALAKEHGINYPFQDIEMDLTAVHLNGCRLKLADLAAAPAHDFSHDIVGICRHIDRKTGKFQHFFLPRYAQKG